MEKPEDFPITRKWKPENPSLIQLYSAPTPNGVKISIALEEMGLAYEVHLVSLEKGEQHSPEFLSLNPNGKIPAILDPGGPNAAPLGLFESGAILIYLAEKSGKFLPEDPARRYETVEWLMFQMGNIGPLFGQMAWFLHQGGKEIEDPRPRTRYVKETARLLRVLEQRLEGRKWVMGEEYTIADMAIAPWLRPVIRIPGASDLVGWEELSNVPAYLERFLARPAVKAGLGKLGAL